MLRRCPYEMEKGCSDFKCDRPHPDCEYYEGPTDSETVVLPSQEGDPKGDKG